MMFPRWILGIDASRMSADQARALGVRLDSANVVQVHSGDPLVVAAFRESFGGALDQRELWVVADLSAAAKVPALLEPPLFAVTIRYDDCALRPLLLEMVAALHDRGTVVFVDPVCEPLGSYHLSGAYQVAPGAGCTPALIIDGDLRLTHPGSPETWVDFREGVLSSAMQTRWVRARTESETHLIPGPVSLPEYPDVFRTFWGGGTMALGATWEARSSKIAFGMSTTEFDAWAMVVGDCSFGDTDFPTFLSVEGAVGEKEATSSSPLGRRKWEFILASWILLGLRDRLRQAFGIAVADHKLDLAEVRNRPQEMFGAAVILIVRSKAPREQKLAAVRSLSLLGAGHERAKNWRNVVGGVDADLGAELERRLGAGHVARRARQLNQYAMKYLDDAIGEATSLDDAT